MAVLSSSSFDSWNTPLSNRNWGFVFMSPRRVLSDANLLPENRISLMVVGAPSVIVNDTLTVVFPVPRTKLPLTVTSV